MRFSLGFNFEDDLICGLAALNGLTPSRQVQEVFGALAGGPISSARPTNRIPKVSWRAFTQHVQQLADIGIEFNYLLNTNQRVGSEDIPGVEDYVRSLRDVGVSCFTVGNPEIADIVRRVVPDAHTTMSITRGVRTIRQLQEAVDSGCDATYLDGVYVNRDFKLLRELVASAQIECRLYANMSCISACPVVRQHYNLFAGDQTDESTLRSDAYFAGCTLTKLNSAVEWIQMPWIRPEDIGAYVDEGIGHFKLADRLAPTEVLLWIAQYYLLGKSPPNLFQLVERDGTKYHKTIKGASERQSNPLNIRSDRIPAGFVEHFRSGACRSQDDGCPVCVAIATAAVEVSSEWSSPELNEDLVPHVPLALRSRSSSNL